MTIYIYAPSLGFAFILLIIIAINTSKIRQHLCGTTKNKIVSKHKIKDKLKQDKKDATNKVNDSKNNSKYLKEKEFGKSIKKINYQYEEPINFEDLK